MTITLQPEHEKLIAQAMLTGAYETPDEVVRRALEILNSEEQWLQEHRLRSPGRSSEPWSSSSAGSVFRPMSRKLTWRNGRQRGSVSEANGVAVRRFRRSPERPF